MQTRLLLRLAAFVCAISFAVVVPAQVKEIKDDRELLKDIAESERQHILDDPFDFSKEPVLPKIDAPTQEAIGAAIEKGIAFLLTSQNKDGSWGTPDASRPFQIYAPLPGAHDAFRSAVTAMCVSALIETGSEKKEVLSSIERGDKWLRENIGQVKRATPDAIYNVWSHAYSIQAFVRLHNRATKDERLQTEYKKLIQNQMEMLKVFESVDGGWGYYDFVAGAARPTSASTSFVNAAVLIAFKEAEKIGVKPDEAVVKRAFDSTIRQQKPDFTYLYGEYLKNQPARGINRPAGSLGRSQACNVALRQWGDTKITDLVLKNWLYRLYVRNGWLSIGRKRPIPHEAWFQVAGYFYYFGHYYAAYAIDELKPEDRQPYQDQLAAIILQYQETDGSWWDYPMYGYHRPYGTAYALMTLQRCLHK